MLTAAVAIPDLVLALHILGAIVGFGILFVFPLLCSLATRLQPGVIPWLLQVRVWIGRWFVNSGLTLVLAAGIYLATDEHFWRFFFVAWGIGAVIALGAIEGGYMIPRAKRLGRIAARDLTLTPAAVVTPTTGAAPTTEAAPATGAALATEAAPATGAAPAAASVHWSVEFERGARRLAAAGWLMAAIVVTTAFMMTTHA